MPSVVKHIKLVATGTGLLWLLSISIVPTNTESSPSSSGKDRYCGIKLIQTLTLLCDHCYKLPPRGVGKRTEGHHFLQLLLNRPQSHLSLESPELGKSEYNSDSSQPAISKRQAPYIYGRRSGGIANKCCLESCTQAELKGYCCKKS